MEEESEEESATEESANEQSNSDPSSSSSPSENEEQYGAGEKHRRKQSRKMFFEGQARKPYRLRKRLRRSLEDNDTVQGRRQLSKSGGAHAGPWM